MSCPVITAQPAEERDFQQLVHHIGGKEKIYLVSDASCKPDQEEEGEGEKAGILQELVQDMFYSKERTELYSAVATSHVGQVTTDTKTLPLGNEIPLSERPRDLGLGAKSTPVGEDKEKKNPPHALNGNEQRTRETPRYGAIKRTIDSPIIIFIFRQEFFSETSLNNEICLREILKDVRARTTRPRVTRGGHCHPALIGLIRSRVESAQTRVSVALLEGHLRAVFRKHPHEAIWVGTFIPKMQDRILDIKRNTCKAMHASQSSDNNTGDGGDASLWPFRCLPLSRRRGPRDQAKSTSPPSRQRGDGGSVEEGVPLKSRVLSASAGPPADSGATAKDSHHHA